MTAKNEGQGRRVAFVGSRAYPESAYKYIRNAINVLPPNAVVISGGASGVDSKAVSYAISRRLEYEVITARNEDNEFDTFRAFQRNSEIVASADEVMVYWDKQSNGTRHAIKAAHDHSKPVTVTLPSGVQFSPANVLQLSAGSIVYATGDILTANTDVIVNPCNTKGVYGAGLSKALADHYDWWTTDYKYACRTGAVKVGEAYFTASPVGTDYPSVLHFPTKDHWRDDSKMEYISTGLEHFASNYKAWGIRSIAFPKIGCGLGGLKWGLVRMYMEQALSELSGIDIVVYV